MSESFFSKYSLSTISSRSVNRRNHLFCLAMAIILAAAVNLFVFCPPCSAEEAGRLMVAEFSEGRLENWEKKSFKGNTQYRLVRINGQTVLKATAADAASGLFKNMRVDLSRTPYLNWSWRVIKPHPPLDETTKAGDDYAARVYIIVDGGLLFWQTIALNYVWSSSQPAGSTWPNAYAGDNVMLMSLRSDRTPPLQWHHEKRNVYDDFKKLFHKEITHIDAVAIMTDSDNSKGQVSALYGDIFFSAK